MRRLSEIPALCFANLPIFRFYLGFRDFYWFNTSDVRNHSIYELRRKTTKNITYYYTIYLYTQSQDAVLCWNDKENFSMDEKRQISSISSKSSCLFPSIEPRKRNGCAPAERRKFDCMFPMLFWIYLLYSFFLLPQICGRLILFLINF